MSYDLHACMCAQFPALLQACTTVRFSRARIHGLPSHARLGKVIRASYHDFTLLRQKTSAIQSRDLWRTRLAIVLRIVY